MSVSSTVPYLIYFGVFVVAWTIADLAGLKPAAGSLAPAPRRPELRLRRLLPAPAPRRPELRLRRLAPARGLPTLVATASARAVPSRRRRAIGGSASAGRPQPAHGAQPRSSGPCRNPSRLKPRPLAPAAPRTPTGMGARPMRLGGRASPAPRTPPRPTDSDPAS